MNRRPLLPLRALALGMILAVVPVSRAAGFEFPALSPAATVKQKIGVTDVEIAYSRPGVRGREIFGAMIPYGEVWRTGANAATRLSFSTDVTLGGARLSAGVYELFTIPGRSEWTVIVQKLREKASWGAYAYRPEDDAARVTVKPVTLATPVETFAIGLSELTDTGATLTLEWEWTRVPVKLQVDTVGMLMPRIQAAIAAGDDTSWEFYYNAASLLFNNGGDLGQSLAWANESLKLRADYPGTLLLKTRLLVRLGRPAEAKAAAAETVANGLKLEGPNSVMARQARNISESLQ